MKETLLRILNEIEPDADYAQSADYIEDGLLDSLGVITLIELIESEFKIKIDGTDVIYENFKNLDAVINMIEKYLK